LRSRHGLVVRYKRTAMIDRMRRRAVVGPRVKLVQLTVKLLRRDRTQRASDADDGRSSFRSVLWLIVELDFHSRGTGRESHRFDDGRDVAEGRVSKTTRVVH